METLWIVSELFYPSETSTAYILTEIANGLSEKYNVRVITCNNAYIANGSQSDLQLDNRIKVVYAKSPNLSKNNLFGRLIRLFISGYNLYKTAKKNISKNDKVLIVTNPAPLVPLMSRLKRKIGFTLNILIHDVFPENLVPAGIRLPKYVYIKIKNLYDKSYACADKLIVLGRDMKDVMQQKICKYNSTTLISIIENWAEIDRISPKEFPQQNVVHIQYAGNIGRLQGLESFVRILYETSVDGIRFDLWGNGAVEQHLKEYTVKMGLNNIFFNGAYQRSMQSEIIGSCDIALVTLADGMCGLGVPSKTYNIMAAGRPILYIGDLNSEVALMIQEHSIGFTFAATDEDGIKLFLKQLTDMDKIVLKDMGARARDLAVSVYSKYNIIDKFTALI